MSDADFTQALEHEAAGRYRESFELLGRLANAGHAGAQYVLGEKLMVGRNAPRQGRTSVQLFAAATQQGHPEAMTMTASLIAAGYGHKQDWAGALNLLAAAAARGDPRAQGQLKVLGPPQSFDLSQWLKPPPPKMAFESPRIGVIEHFIAPEVCDWLIDLARPSLARAFIVDQATGERRFVETRTNTGMYIGWLESDVIVRLVKSRIATALGTPVGQQEFPNILHYEVGQTFDTHFDFLDPAQPGYAQELNTLGQRIATFLIYLNEDFDGGETDFPRLRWSFKGKKGDAIFFWNVDPSGGVEPQLLHAGRPPSRGEKWLFSQWVRARHLELI